MKTGDPCLAMGLLGVWLALLCLGCGAVRSEFYRAEVRGLYQEGCDRFRGGDLAGARGQLRQVAVLDPSYAEAFLVLGHIAKAEGDPNLAEEQYRRALREDPRLAEVVLQSLLALAEHRRAQGLASADLDLAAVLSLLSTGDEALIRRTFEAADHLEATVMDAASVSPVERSRLADIVAGRLLSGRASRAEACFGGLFLAQTEGRACLAVRALGACPDGFLPPETVRRQVVALRTATGDRDGALTAAQAGAADGQAWEDLERITGVPSDAFEGAASGTAWSGGPETPPDAAPRPWFRLLEQH